MGIRKSEGRSWRWRLIPAAGAVGLALTVTSCGPLPIIGTWLGRELTTTSNRGSQTYTLPITYTYYGDSYSVGVRLTVDKAEQLSASFEVYYSYQYAGQPPEVYVDTFTATLEKKRRKKYTLLIPDMWDFDLECTVHGKDLECEGVDPVTSDPQDDEQLTLLMERQ